jgi:hypothetical protein
LRLLWRQSILLVQMILKHDFAAPMKFCSRRLSALGRNRIAHGATCARNAGWREPYDGFVLDIRLHQLIRKGLLGWWKAELLNLRFIFAARRPMPHPSVARAVEA